MKIARQRLPISPLACIKFESSSVRFRNEKKKKKKLTDFPFSERLKRKGSSSIRPSLHVANNEFELVQFVPRNMLATGKECPTWAEWPLDGYRHRDRFSGDINLTADLKRRMKHVRETIARY